MFRGAMPLIATVPRTTLLMYGYGVGKSVGTRDGAAESSLLPVFVGAAPAASCSPSSSHRGAARCGCSWSPGGLPSMSGLTLELRSPGHVDGAAAAGAMPRSSAGPLRDPLAAAVHGVWFSHTSGASPRATSGGVAARSARRRPAATTEHRRAAGRRLVRRDRRVGRRLPGGRHQDALPNGGRAGTVMEAVRAIHAEGGVRAFYHGLGLKLLRAVPQSACGFFVYEYTMAALARRKS